MFCFFISLFMCSVKKQGIIGIVCVIDHIIWNNENSTEIDDINSDAIVLANDLPDESAQTAGKLIGIFYFVCLIVFSFFIV